MKAHVTLEIADKLAEIHARLAALALLTSYPPEHCLDDDERDGLRYLFNDLLSEMKALSRDGA